MDEKQRIYSFIQDDIKAPIQRLVKNGDIESAEILVYTRIDTMRHLTPSLFEDGDGVGDKYKKWVSQFMPLTYRNGVELTSAELWSTRCDYVHNGGASVRNTGIRRVVLRDETTAETPNDRNEVRISISDFVTSFGISTRECYQWICADDARLLDALSHLEKMKYVRVNLDGLGVSRSHMFENFSDDRWRLYYDLGDEHEVECTLYLCNSTTGTIEQEDIERLKKSIEGYANLHFSNELLAYQVETTSLLWTKDVTDQDHTTEELFEMARNCFDNWYRNSGAHKHYNIAAIGSIRTRRCQHGRERLTENRLCLFPYQDTPVIP